MDLSSLANANDIDKIKERLTALEARAFGPPKPPSENPPAVISGMCAECNMACEMNPTENRWWSIRNRETGAEIVLRDDPYTGIRERICPPCAKKLWHGEVV